MDLRGKNVVLMGRFHKLPQAKAKAGLVALGARVSGALSQKTDLVFAAYDVEGRRIGEAALRGVPVYDSTALRAVLRSGSGPADTEPGRGGAFADHGSLASAGDPATLLGLLQRADWSAFVAERDLSPLRAALLELERAHGVTEAHALATERLRGLGGTRLVHPYGHATEITSHAFSPCGRYLATGSWVGDDYHLGGALGIWEVASGRCVNVLSGVSGGVGWPDYDDVIQWSADGTRVGLAYSTNQVGVFDPFGRYGHPLASASVTDGASRPPDWALAPDGRRAFVSTGSPCALKGCVIPLEAGHLSWLPNHAAAGHPYLLPDALPEGGGGERGELWLDGGASWSRDGTRLSAYDPERGREFVIDLADRRVAWATEDEEETAGTGDGSAGARVSVEPTRVTFERPATREVLGDFTFLREPAAPRLIAYEYPHDDLGVEFALDDHTWCAAFESGVVIAPPNRAEELDAVLAWSVDRRFAWPVRWGGLEIVPDIRAAADRLPDDVTGFVVRECVERLDAGQSTTSWQGAWPPPNTATLDDLFSAARDAVSSLRGQWDFVVNEQLRDVVRLRARRGEPDGVTALLPLISDTEWRVLAAAQAALLLARGGRPEEARAVFAVAEEGVEAALGGYRAAQVAASVAGAHHALGDEAAADAWFARAKGAIETEVNAWEHRLAVIWALAECGREAEARSLWTSCGKETRQPNGIYVEPWLLCLVTTDRLDLAEEFMEAWVPRHDRPSSLIDALVELGRPDLLRAWVGGAWYIPEEKYERAQAIADGAPRRSLPPTPTEEDIAALAKAHAELLTTPRARRKHPTRELIDQAADRGHLSAVLDLLGTLPTDDYNDRASAAFTALWRATTGHWHAPW
ncbi:WD40 repeat domain-containing protein [Streptomyces hainanensis]|uniref:BRCT domain-containing protein n=1 Tax=Streptomyces hainanensis TaxID=402648 RepID=A0A4R4TKL5_9ACTN|nr:hypothetical protein [Streptomyces hainanensis]TDC77066.1 hypothetical protein E1283_08210 [Streptomyces hainanensis]